MLVFLEMLGFFEVLVFLEMLGFIEMLGFLEMLVFLEMLGFAVTTTTLNESSFDEMIAVRYLE